MKEALWLRKLMPAFGHSISQPTIIYEDNTGCIAIANNKRGMNHRTKHVATRYFAIREQVDQGNIAVERVDTDNQNAYICTTGQPNVTFVMNAKRLGLLPSRL